MMTKIELGLTETSQQNKYTHGHTNPRTTRVHEHLRKHKGNEAVTMHLKALHEFVYEQDAR